MSNIAKVQSFIALWEARDLEGILAAFHDQPVYHNIPMAALTSKADIRAFIAPFLEPVTAVQWTVHFIAENAAGVVLTERTDAFFYGDKRIAVPVMGTFEFVDGKLAKWRDYFDMRDFETQMAALSK